MKTVQQQHAEVLTRRGVMLTSINNTCIVFSESQQKWNVTEVRSQI